ncbi:MAG: WXG100 family type VII secretion target [Oscillospiraceae bacterium]|jgi:WXG100 family type VII secretion target|nr:WXG100 family type VII secretion target [Oscillospiraceae bacterium]
MNEIVANSAQLRSYAEKIENCYTALRNGLLTSKSKVDSMKNVWTGDAAVAYNASFNAIFNQCGDTLDTVISMASAMYEAADTYEKTEKAVTQKASEVQKLPNNVMK